MAGIGGAVLQHAGAGRDRVADPAVGQQAADRGIAAAQALGHGEDVGVDPVLGAGIHVAGAAHAAHDLVEDQQHAVAVADLAQALEVARHRRRRAETGAGDRLGDEGGDVLPARACRIAASSSSAIRMP